MQDLLELEGVLRSVTLERGQNGVVVPMPEYVTAIYDLTEDRMRDVRVNRAVIRFFSDPTKVYAGANCFVVIPGKLWGAALVDGEPL